MRSPNIRYVAGVDHLRAFAAILIVLYHGLALFAQHAASGLEEARYVQTLNPLLAVVFEGHTAVGLFMVLSGFIFALGSRNHEIEWRGFLRNRCLRIVPLMVALIVVGMYAFPEQVTLAGLAQHGLLLSNLPGAAPLGPFNLMFWTIAVEFQFYLIFPFLLRFVREGGAWYVVNMIVLMLAFRFIAVANGANARDLSYWTIVGRLDQFLLGILLGLNYRQSESSFRARWTSLGTTSLFTIATLFAFHLLGGHQRVATWKIIWPTVEAAVWVLFIRAYLDVAEDIRPRWSAAFCGIGALSFSIYMMHRIVIDTLTNRNWVFATSPTWNTLLLALPLTLGLSFLTYSLIEKPFLDLRGSYRKSTAEASKRIAA